MNVKSIVAIAMGAALFSASCNNTESDKTVTDSSSASNSALSPAAPMEPNDADVRTVQIPDNTRTHFEAKYPQASNVSWSRYQSLPNDMEWEWYEWPAMDTNDYVASWNVNQNPYWVWYDQDGNWVGSMETINVASVPDAVNKKLNTEFTGYTVASVNKENDKNRVAYEIKLTKGSDMMKVLIDEKGNVMKKKGTVDGEKVKEKNI